MTNSNENRREIAEKLLLFISSSSSSCFCHGLLFYFYCYEWVFRWIKHVKYRESESVSASLEINGERASERERTMHIILAINQNEISFFLMFDVVDSCLADLHIQFTARQLILFGFNKNMHAIDISVAAASRSGDKCTFTSDLLFIKIK